MVIKNGSFAVFFIKMIDKRLTNDCIYDIILISPKRRRYDVTD